MSEKYTVSTFYKFAELTGLRAKQKSLKAFMQERGVLGTVLLAQEGINGTITGKDEAVEEVLSELKLWHGFADLTDKKSYCDFLPFEKAKVKVRAEIITMKDERIDPVKQAGKHVSAKKWNELLQDQNVIAIDTRNDYEVEMGTFKGMIDPKTENFKEFKSYVRENLASQKDKTVIMCCTGGVRCEKASAFMMAEGFKEVLQLDGGILKYFEQIPEAESLWRGNCFVFDDREAVDQNLQAVGNKKKSS